jgi:hypothetical protein
MTNIKIVPENVQKLPLQKQCNSLTVNRHVIDKRVINADYLQSVGFRRGFPRYFEYDCATKGINSGVFCLSEYPSYSDVTIQLAMLLVLRCRNRYLFPLRYVCRCLQLNIGCRPLPIHIRPFCS